MVKSSKVASFKVSKNVFIERLKVRNWKRFCERMQVYLIVRGL